MRQVFSSPRIENVEGVARLLQDAGIEVHITSPRSYRGAIRGNFSYRDSEREKKGAEPAVWIVQSEDQPRARQMLREAGLLDTTRTPNNSFALPTMHSRAEQDGNASRKRAFRLKAGLLVLIAAAIGIGVLGLRKSPPATPASTATIGTSVPADAAGSTTAPPAAPPAFVLDTPPALAETLLRIELTAQMPAQACIAIDGKDPPAATLAALQNDTTAVAAHSACNADKADVRFDITDYRSDGSGVGTVQLDMIHRAAEAAPRTESRVLEVERTGDTWRIVRMR